MILLDSLLLLFEISIAAGLIYIGLKEMYDTNSSSGGFNLFLGFFILLLIIGIFI